jgi:hypothetical protein
VEKSTETAAGCNLPSQTLIPPAAARIITTATIRRINRFFAAPSRGTSMMFSYPLYRNCAANPH